MTQDNGIYKVRSLKTTPEEKYLIVPRNTTGHYRRDVSKDGMTITYRKVA
jgi:hypothetical protein